MSQHPNVPPERRRRRTGAGTFWRIWTSEPRFLVGLAAFVTAIATVLGLFIRNQGEQRQAAVEPTTSATVASAATVAPVSATDSTDSTAAAAEAPTTSAGTRRQSAGVFSKTGGAPVVVGSCIDLDSQEPNWGVGSRSHKDICASFGSNGAARINATELAVVARPPTLEHCEKQTVLRPSTTTAETVVGQHLCVRSSDKRWAHVRIAAIDRSASTMSFDIVVWKLPSDP